MIEAEWETLRAQARMHALVAEMYAVTARIEGCKVANAEREASGLAMAYPESIFNELATELEGIAVRLRIA